MRYQWLKVTWVKLSTVYKLEKLPLPRRSSPHPHSHYWSYAAKAPLGCGYVGNFALALGVKSRQSRLSCSNCLYRFLGGGNIFNSLNRE